MLFEHIVGPGYAFRTHCGSLGKFGSLVSEIFWGLELMIHGCMRLRLGVEGSGFETRVLGFGSRVSCLRSRGWDLGSRISGFGYIFG